MALSNLALFGGAFFTPVLVGKITHTIGWQWSFNLVAIFAGALLPLVFFFVPETAYTRPSNPYVEALENGDSRRLNNDNELPPSNGSDTKSTPTTSNPTSFEKNHDYSTNKTGLSTYAQSPNESLPPPKATFAQSLLPFNGRKSNANFFKLLLRPFPLFLHPAVLWACLIQGTLIGWVRDYIF